MSGLSERLKTLRQFNALKPLPAAERNSAANPDGPFPGWTQKDGLFWVRESIRELSVPDNLPDPFLIPEGTGLSDLIFYDTETTGLSGGAGTTAFLIGTGRLEKNQIRVTQFFLPDYPGEPEMLAELKKYLPEQALYVSYNGKTYDSHLLQTRFRMNRIPFCPGRQLDLLYPARKLWKNCLETCTLSSLEVSILKKERDLDIPGREIPEVWFDFLRTGRGEKLKAVFAHNLEDIVSLAEILFLIEGLRSRDNPDMQYDRLALALMVREKHPEEGLGLLEKLAEEKSRPAMIRLSLEYKGQGRWEQASEIWEEINRGKFSFFAALELAKYYEHRKNNPEAALKIITPFLCGGISLKDSEKEALRYRTDRLQRKITARQGKENNHG